MPRSAGIKQVLEETELKLARIGNSRRGDMGLQELAHGLAMSCWYMSEVAARSGNRVSMTRPRWITLYRALNQIEDQLTHHYWENYADGE